MEKILNKLICIILILSMPCFLVSCKDEVTKTPVVDGKEVVYGDNMNLFSYYPDTLNPYTTGIKQNYDILMLVYEGLFSVKSDSEIVPLLASDYSVENNGTKYVITLKENVKFHNGKIFDAKDVIFTLDYIKDYAPNFIYLFDNVKSYKQENGKVVFNLNAPQFNFISRLDFPIMPSNTIVDVLNENPINIPIGTGAFKFGDDLRQKEVTLLKNENYHVPSQPYLGSVTVRFLKDSSVAVSAFNNNEISVILSDQFVWGDVSFTTECTQLDVIGDNFYFMAFNYDNELLNDVNIRKIFLCMINKEELVQKVFRSKADMTNSTLNPRLSYGGVYKNMYDLKNVENYAKEAGFSDKDHNGVYEKMVEENWYSLSFSLLVNSDDQMLAELSKFLLQSAKDAKISLDIKYLSGEEYDLALENKEYDIVLCKEQIKIYDNLSEKIDFNAKYSVPYDMYLSLSKIISQFPVKNPLEKAKEFDEKYTDLVPCVAICYDTNSILWHSSVKNMSYWQNARLKGVAQSFISFK